MRWTFIFCVFLLIVLPNCKLLELLNSGIGENVGRTESEPSQDTLPQSQGELVAQALDLFTMDDSCKLPCFGDLTPRISTEEDIRNFLDNFDVDSPQVEVSQFGTDDYGLSLFFDPNGLLLVDLLVEDEKLSYTTIGISSVHDWSAQTLYDLPVILNELGSPDDVFVLFFGPPLSFSLIVLYNTQGVMFRYQATYQDIELVDSDEPLPICLHQDTVDLQQIDVWLQSATDVDLVEENQPDLRDEREFRPFWEIQRIANITMEQFTNYFIENPQGCLPTSTFSELGEMGYQF